MEQQSSPSGQGPGHVIHEYPDPDYAAYVNKYPWREDNGHILSALHDLPLQRSEKVAPPGNYDGLRRAQHDGSEAFNRNTQWPAMDATMDHDYQMSEAGVS